MQALPIDIPNLSAGPVPKDPNEAKAGRLVCSMILRVQEPDGNPVGTIARVLEDKYSTTVWGNLGIYWYFLSSGQHAKAAICDQIVRSRFMEMDAQQSHFYRQCLPWMKKVQCWLSMPAVDGEADLAPPPFLRTSEPDTGKPETWGRYVKAPRQTKSETIQVCKPNAFRKILEAEQEKEIRALMDSLVPITQAKKLAKLPTGALEQIENLKEEQPNMSEAVEVIVGELRARQLADAPAKMPPILLCGSPGTGKTRLVCEIARILGVPYTEIPLAGSGDSFKITGLSRYWRSAGCGLIARTFCDNDEANPVFIFDEIDKAGRSESGSPHDAILQLLEERTARTFRDELILAPIDVSHASFLATANSIDHLPEPLLSRFIVIEVPEMTLEDRLKVTNSIYKQLCASEPYGGFFSESLESGVAGAMAEDQKLSPRLIRRHLRHAMHQACKTLTSAPAHGSTVLERPHLPQSLTHTKGRVGFIR